MVAGQPRFRTLEAADLDEARTQRTALQALAELGSMPLSPRLTFAEVARRWLEEFEAKVAVNERRARMPSPLPSTSRDRRLHRHAPVQAARAELRRHQLPGGCDPRPSPARAWPSWNPAAPGAAEDARLAPRHPSSPPAQRRLARPPPSFALQQRLRLCVRNGTGHAVPAPQHLQTPSAAPPGTPVSIATATCASTISVTPSPAT
jgi:hypothetical protein